MWVRCGLTTRRARLVWAAEQNENRPKRQYRVLCPFCHKSFLATGNPPSERCRGWIPRQMNLVGAKTRPRTQASPKWGLNY